MIRRQESDFPLRIGVAQRVVILHKALIINTLWRWVESPANRSLGQIPC